MNVLSRLMPTSRTFTSAPDAKWTRRPGSGKGNDSGEKSNTIAEPRGTANTMPRAKPSESILALVVTPWSISGSYLEYALCIVFVFGFPGYKTYPPDAAGDAPNGIPIE